jgi:hypothetical protein
MSSLVSPSLKEENSQQKERNGGDRDDNLGSNSKTIIFGGSCTVCVSISATTTGFVGVTTWPRDGIQARQSVEFAFLDGSIDCVIQTARKV